MLRRILGSLIAIVALVALLLPGSGTPVGASSGSETDPTGDATIGGGDGTLPIDIVRVTHDDPSGTIVYTMQAAADFNETVRQDHSITWVITSGEMFATVDAGADGPLFICDSDATESAVTVTRESSGAPGSTANNTVKVTYPESLLTDCGLENNTYTYYVDVEHPSDDTGYDEVPDVEEDPNEITHTLSGDTTTTTSTTTTSSTTTSTTTPTTTSTTTTSTTTPSTTTSSTTTSSTTTSSTTTSSTTTSSTTTSSTTTSSTTTSTTTPTTTSSTTSTTVAPTTSTTSGATTTTAAGGGTTTTTTAGGGTTTTTEPDGTPEDTASRATVSDNTVTPGQTVTFTGDGFAGDRDLEGTFFSDPIALGTVHSNADGSVVASFVIPRNATLGSHQIVVTGPGPDGETHRAIANLTVVSAGGSGTLPRTGAAALGRWLVGGVLALLVGAYAVWWRRSVADSEFWL